MANPVKPIPEGYHTITPSLICKNAAQAIEFYKKAFGAVERARMATPDGKIGHAEMKIGDSIFFVSDEFPQMGALAPTPDVPFGLYLYVDGVDAVFRRAVDAGAKVLMPVQDQFWGDRNGSLLDPYGYRWGISTHVEDITPEEMDRRSKAFMQRMAAQG